MSTNIIVRPMLTLLFFATIAATISVPPEEPLCMNVVPIPRPHNIAPKATLTTRSGTRMPDTHENALEHTYSESHYRHTENRAQHKLCVPPPL